MKNQTFFIICFIIFWLQDISYAQPLPKNLAGTNTISTKFEVSSGMKGGFVDNKKINSISNVNHDQFLIETSKVCHQIEQKLNCKNGKITNIDYIGDVLLSHMTISDNLNVIGNLTVTNSDMNNVNVMGNVTAKNSSIHRSAVIHGNAKLNHVIFYANAFISGKIDAQKTQFNGIAKTIS
ncbi:MAG: hypothetical protein ACD_46C00525G0001 [uncultured bacterium]|nr:MAG: hypothetical protein ACD_46C00525G0001 [uncultured bacterium]